jgi:hypothetical protein
MKNRTPFSQPFLTVRLRAVDEIGKLMTPSALASIMLS